MAEGIITTVSNVAPALDTSKLTAEQQAAVAAVEAQAGTTPGGALGKDEFLNLLVTQLSYQDPLDPMDSTDSIAQLAQFSALEQMQNVSEQVQALNRNSAMSDAMLLQGQNVQVTDENGAVYSGTVDSAIWGDTGLVLTIGGVSVPMSSIAEMKLLQTEAATDLEESAAEESALPESDVEATTPVEST